MVLLYVGRIYCRLVPVENLWWDDYTISFAVVLSLASFAMQLVAAQHGLGRHTHFVALEDRIQAQRAIFIVSCMWYFGVAFMRMSVGFLLLRFRASQPPTWALVLRIIIAIQFILAIAALVAQLNMCHPLRANWEPVEDAHCASQRFMDVWGYCNTGIGIATDVILSLMPITFVVKLHLSLGRRILICILMGVGLWTAAIALVKTTYIARFSYTDDTLWNMYFLTLWSKFEEVIGIMAACIPCLTSRIEALLRRLGVISPASAIVARLNTFVLNTIGRRTEESEPDKSETTGGCSSLQSAVENTVNLERGVNAGKKDAQNSREEHSHTLSEMES